MPAAALIPVVAAFAWLMPGPVLPTISRTGPEGPPRPYGAAPPPGHALADAPHGLSRAQYRRMLDGPFPVAGLERGVSDGEVLESTSQTVRAQGDELVAAMGARVARIPVDWSSIVSPDPPADFDPADPASPAYDFTNLDEAVESAAAAGLQPLLVVSHAPAFAEAPERWPYAYAGSWAPDPSALGEFATALARRYDGSFPDPADPVRELPQVRMFQAWNEPNLARYLEPQWVVRDGSWSAFAPLLYREMLNAFYAGVKSVQPGASVVSAGLAPAGEPAGVGRMAPLSFLRSMFCIGAAGQRLVAGCPHPPHLDALAFHPLSVGDPDVPAPYAPDLAISDVVKLTRLVARAERLHTALPAGHKALWVTEINWEAGPHVAGGVPASLQARWVSRALHRLWVAGVTQVDWQFLLDRAVLRAETPTGGSFEYERPAGLYSAGPGGGLEGARAKPFLTGFQLPFDPLRLPGTRRVRLWALLPALAHAALQRRGSSGWRTIARLRAGADGVLNVLLSVAGPAELRLRSGARLSYEVRLGRPRLRPPAARSRRRP